ncbi:hypothetical protein C0214_19590 [Methylobacterium sp. DM1]|nr:hypothetical protein C0214_19590 [Methylobacterium sp. DM1]
MVEVDVRQALIDGLAALLAFVPLSIDLKEDGLSSDRLVSIALFQLSTVPNKIDEQAALALRR